ncbi:unnamed protein product (macronuclear) [Paramecium tetraurelia]|uniref:Uncharacterized protein n=1 Tax=Paramecium tetraurelia TaxID=5888 RepID=A0D3U3_PARTE|nr:uncharacterized protein GSPATT00013175001 [Paramecium tetraurelia]CAK77710.1 unnamed protein product [Paramecium tetraurelia]|eukprot:XP_001445107.1 hypothetical protein (macronuclear) [Paramecium tetraurelia strain d4-2]
MKYQYDLNNVNKLSHFKSYAKTISNLQNLSKQRNSFYRSQLKCHFYGSRRRLIFWNTYIKQKYKMHQPTYISDTLLLHIQTFLD